MSSVKKSETTSAKIKTGDPPSNLDLPENGPKGSTPKPSPSKAKHDSKNSDTPETVNVSKENSKDPSPKSNSKENSKGPTPKASPSKSNSKENSKESTPKSSPSESTPDSESLDVNGAATNNSRTSPAPSGNYIPYFTERAKKQQSEVPPKTPPSANISPKTSPKHASFNTKQKDVTTTPTDGVESTEGSSSSNSADANIDTSQTKSNGAPKNQSNEKLMKSTSQADITTPNANKNSSPKSPDNKTDHSVEIIDDENTRKLSQQDNSSDADLEKNRTYPSSLIKKESLDLDTSDDSGNKKSAVAGDVCRVFGVMFALGVRAFLLAFCTFTVWLVVYRLENNMYYLLTLSFIFFIVETINIVVTRAGQERKWFCLCFLCYLIAVIPCIWLLELDRLESFQDAVSNTSNVVVDVAGVTASVKLDPSTLLSVTEQCLLFLLILSRWLLPRGDITRDQLSQLLFVYIGMASDVMELFQLFDEENVRKDRVLTYAILSVWSLSLLQFTLVLTMSQSPKKPRTALDHTAEKQKKLLKESTIVAIFTQSELWSLFVSMFMQDGPFLAVRLYTIVSYDLINYTIIFFTCKNILVILLLFYRTLVLCLEKMEEDDDDDDDDDDAESLQDDRKHRSKTASTHLSVSDIEDESLHSQPVTNGTNQDGVRARHANQVAPV